MACSRETFTFTGLAKVDLFPVRQAIFPFAISSPLSSIQSVQAVVGVAVSAEALRLQSVPSLAEDRNKRNFSLDTSSVSLHGPQSRYQAAIMWATGYRLQATGYRPKNYVHTDVQLTFCGIL
jgi:hypothetical protein